MSIMAKHGEWPFGITPENYPEFIGRCSEHITRRGDDLAGHYLERPDPDAVIYEVYEAEPVGGACLALTVIKPGKVGREYHMTKGHYHEDPQAGELYFCLKGRGMLVLQTRDGNTAEIALEPGSAASIPPGWAHRTVNVCKDDFVMLAVFSADAGHDYAAIERDGFLKRVVEQKGKPQVV
jgi:glucose-6-phosphate isomerase